MVYRLRHIAAQGCRTPDMSQVMTDRVASIPAAFVFHSRPRCSLTPMQACRFFWGTAGVCLGTGIGFAALGYWLILPFAGLEVGLLGWALAALHARSGDYETLTIDGDALVLEWRSGAGSGRRELNRQWARVVCDCAAPGRNCRLRVRSHGCETEVGHYLSDAARLRLAAALRSRMYG